MIRRWSLIGETYRAPWRSSALCRLPVLPYEPAAGDDVPQREHRRVGGEEDELAARRCQLEAAIERLLQSRDDLDRAVAQAAVLEAQAELGRALTRRDQRLEARDERLEVDVPD